MVIFPEPLSRFTVLLLPGPQYLQAELRAQNGTLTTKQLETVHFMPRNRSALKITEAELKLIASAAIIGDSSQPVNG